MAAREGGAGDRLVEGMTRRPRVSVRSRGWPWIAAAGVAALVVVLAVASGSMDSSNTTLVLMGFDQDRAQLITSLLIGAVASAAALLATNGNRPAIVAGLLAVAALFGHTFFHETRAALESTGIDGTFDPIGWLMTSVTLATMALIVGWAGAALAQSLRPPLIDLGVVIREAVRARRLERASIRLPLGAVIVVLLLVVTLPVFGDMVNYTPDSRMLHGGAPPVGLVPGDPSATSTAGDVPSASATSGASATPSHSPSASPVPVDRPWLAWRPSGIGAVNLEHLPAPWRGGSATDAVGIYTPPGYKAGGGRRYPVLYEAPNTYAAWDAAVNVHVILDTLIDDGSIPAMIVVFVDAQGGPYPDSECANSTDGREWMDTFISQTVVSYVDTHYMTIKQAEGRGITGFSQGGYCAAVLALRHPSVFGTAMPISGYFRAGQGDSTSTLPFGGSVTALRAASPIDIAPTLSAAARASLFFVLIVSPAQPFYGAAATAFERVIDTNGYPYVVQDAKVPHGWVQVREQLPGALKAWATHLAVSGVL